MPPPDLASEILAYLDKHPHAVDSIAGITSDWVTSGDYDPSEVERVLEALAEEGLINRIILTNGSAVYGRLATART